VAVGRALGRPAEIRYRPDGRPEVDGDRAISVSHGPGVTLAVAARGTVGCDVEAVAERSAETWDGLLGSHSSLADLAAKESGDGRDTAATRVWTAMECLQKAGLPPSSPLTLLPAERDAWTVFASGALRIATLVTTLRDTHDPVVFAVLTKGGA
jgi:enediyne polyketide synthase